MRFQIAFHGPFRVGTGRAAPGVDVAIDPDDPLPATSLKGVMRAAAAALFGNALTAEVFGSPATPSPWTWSPGNVRYQRRRRARVAIDPETGTAVKGALVFSDELWADSAEFTVEARTALTSDAQRRHELVLAASASMVQGLGADRRRGFGWVSIRPMDRPLGEGDIEELMTMAVGT